MASVSSNNGKHYIGLEKRRAIIFYNGRNKTDRSGMQKDSENLIRILEKLKFKVQPEIRHPMTAVELIETLKAFCDKNITASCLFVFILTHGDETTLEADGGSYEINKLLSTVSTDKNKNIPKIVFIDACLCDKERDYGFVVTMDATDGKSDQALTQSQLPPNLLVACATTPVYPSFAEKEGSAFIEQICNLLQKRDDFMSSLSVVNYEVSKLTRREDKTNEVVKQMPFIMSNLTSKLYLETVPSPRNCIDDDLSLIPAKANIKREHLDKYNMEYGLKGLAVILYDSGTVKNPENYKKLFEKLDSFSVQEYKIEVDLKKTLETVHKEYKNHEQYSCFVCCIVAKYSGKQPCILFPPYWKDDMQEYFGNDTCNFFVGKPKIFVMHLEENETQVHSRSIPDERDETDGKVRIPRAADILIYSVKENFTSESHPTTAAAEISAKLKSAQLTKKDVVTALTEASQAITEKKKPTPTTFSTLTGKVFL